ncbi:RlpA-like double-psi beta-barrel domain-containing protein [Acidipropionibacterium timonense]|uniref:RlpA-like double-psi beta-barrel domain-containing protein n=1 Tax=Acidipropionibacterium timonense TaxID=2161818 RepID=UPI001031BD3A|nr:RlpA-like double-psi beta-barrel domain-containing protein [Acidipropionibacterium timonense]
MNTLTPRTTLRRATALTAVAGLAVMGSVAQEAHAAPVTAHPTQTVTKAPAQQRTITTRYAVAKVNVNVRTGGSISHSKIGLLLGGHTVTVTGPTVNGWAPVTFNGKSAWICAKYLSIHTSTKTIYAERGDHNSHSTNVQSKLASLGYFPSSWVGAKYGPATTNAVKAFQRAHGLSATGITDSSTWAAMQRAAANRSSSSSSTPSSTSTSSSRSSSSSTTSRSSSRTSSSSSSSTSTYSSSSSSSTSGVAGTCQASYYTDTQTASGEAFSSSALTAASKTYAFGTKLKVTNTSTGASVIVTINDRGPYVSGRCLDLTPAAFSQIASLGAGVVNVSYSVVG